MTILFVWLLRLAGLGLVSLVIAHVPIARHLRWREEAARLSPANAAIFQVHAWFICLILLLMALPCLFDPLVFLDASPGGAWMAWLFAIFWVLRLYAQWFVYPPTLWRGKRLETSMHWLFSAVWMALAAVFAGCGLIQAGWMR